MSGERALPEQASLRYLKVEAKRRHAAGEFGSLHDAQLAIAREHGQRSWAALREAVSAAGGDGHAVAQLRWIIGRFADTGTPGWAAPDEDELREHFTSEFLATAGPDVLLARITELAPALREDLLILVRTPLTAQARLGGHLITAAAEPRPPYRLSGVQARRLGERVSDPRAASPPASSFGPVPEQAGLLTAQAAARFGLPGLAPVAEAVQ